MQKHEIRGSFNLSVVILLTLLLVIGCGRASVAQKPTSEPAAANLNVNPVAQAPSAPIPTEDQDLYQELSTNLDKFENWLNANYKGERQPLIFGAELIQANGNRGTELLKPQTLKSCELMLNRFQQLGITGVTFAVPYPLLMPSFPNSKDYIAFFRNVTSDVHKRGMKVCIESGHVFPPPYSKINVSYAGITWEKEKQNKRTMTETIVHEIKPDYLLITSEATTSAGITGIKEYLVPQKVVELVQYVLTGLDRQGVLMAAGAGTWDNIAIIEALASKTAVDVIDIHLYPVNRDYLAKVVEFADIAHKYGKRVTMMENWLYKTRDRELGQDGIAETSGIFQRDAYSFFVPLDQKFLSIVVKLANYKQIEYISPFWVQLFFANLPYDINTSHMSYTQIVQELSHAVAPNIMNDVFSETGLYYKQLIVEQSKK